MRLKRESSVGPVGRASLSDHTTMKYTEACERSIILAADGVKRLRKPDVMRVMSDFFFGHGSVVEMVEYITENRPDLADEVKACRLELAKDNEAILSHEDTMAKEEAADRADCLGRVDEQPEI